jgi:FkbM family methyltransferase
MPIEVDPGDIIGREILRQGAWEWETCCFLEQWIAPGMTVIDAGANIGQYAMLASARVGPRGRIHCFEPHPGVYRVLKRNLERAGCANVVAQPVALADVPGERDLFLRPLDNVGSTSFRPDDDGKPGRHVRVKVRTLDAYLESRRVPRVDLIKIDVEGAELLVLDGGIRTLGVNRDVVLVVEFAPDNARRFGHSVEDLAARLLALGFRLFTITLDGLFPYTPVRDRIVNVAAARRLDTLLRGLHPRDAANLLLRLAGIAPASRAPS